MSTLGVEEVKPPCAHAWAHVSDSTYSCTKCGAFDEDEDQRDDSPYCDCGSFPSEEEEASNRCSCCGKRIDL